MNAESIPTLPVAGRIDALERKLRPQTAAALVGTLCALLIVSAIVAAGMYIGV